VHQCGAKPRRTRTVRHDALVEWGFSLYLATNGLKDSVLRALFAGAASVCGMSIGRKKGMPAIYWTKRKCGVLNRRSFIKWLSRNAVSESQCRIHGSGFA
jgi:hypothetical protein